MAAKEADMEPDALVVADRLSRAAFGDLSVCFDLENRVFDGEPWSGMRPHRSAQVVQSGGGSWR
ncbi:hypothetical protein [Novosphingobium lindaniclasticum]|uniref:hypothetical protein n=1 Tax=Novosphingobium lindaniclasticum TaxID=1329895 RepID=UPI0030C691B2